MRTLRRVALTVLLATSMTSAAFAQSKDTDKPQVDVSAEVEAAEQLYAKLDYDKANDTARHVIDQRNVSHDHLVRAYRILAVTAAVLDKGDEAREAFLRLLLFDPEYSVDANMGPKVSTPFVEARGQFRSLPTKAGIAIVANVGVEGGQLRVSTSDPTHIAKKVAVGYRWVSGGPYAVSMVDVGQATVEVSAAPIGRTRLDFYATALDERDNAVFETGNAQAPKLVFIDPSKSTKPLIPSEKEKSSTSFVQSPIFWVLTSAVALGGATALFFAFRPEDAPSRASLSPLLRCGNDPCQ